MKAIQLLLESKIPEDLRDYSRTYDAKSIEALLADVAHKHPEQYTKVIKDVADVGRHASWRQGETLSMDDLHGVVDRDAVLKQMDAEVAQAKKDAISKEDFETQRLQIWGHYNDMLEKATSKAALAGGNNLAYAVLSGARGKSQQLKAMLTTPGLYTDYKGDVIPLFVRHSFGEGLRPAEYLASTFGARQSTVSTKSSTARGGFLGKSAMQATAPLVVTTKDCGSSNGIELSAEDSSLKGRVLARAAGGYPAGAVIDGHAAAQLRKAKVPDVIVRSSLTCQAPEGVCAKCCGQWSGRFPHIGESVGVTDANAVFEPITQGGLSAKHVGGMASGKKEYSGLGVIEQFTTSPEDFPNRAAVAEHDGKVTRIEDAPQGGYFVHVNETPHYVLTGHKVTVKPGDAVEAGDQLSEGLADPGDIVRLRGLGEGRNYYVDRFSKILADSGHRADRRNVEMLARATLNHVLIKDPEGLGDYLPDDTANYAHLAATYTPPDSSKLYEPGQSVGKYLQVPALHYTIGTRITPRIAKHLEKFGRVLASDEAPAFEPVMTNMQTASHEGQTDWIAQMHTSHLKQQLTESAARGRDSDARGNIHFAPALARGESFAKNIEETGRF